METTLVTGVQKNTGHSAKYSIVDHELKVVKKHKSKSLPTLEDFWTPDIDGLDAEAEEINTLILFNELTKAGLRPTKKKKKYENGKYSVIRCKGYEMYYDSFGFKILDMTDYNNSINMNEYNNDFANVEDVISLLNKERKATPIKTHNDEEAEKQKTIKRLKKKYKVTEVTNSEPEIKEDPEDRPLEQVKKDLMEALDKFKAGTIPTNDELTDVIGEVIPKKYRQFKILARKFSCDLNRRVFTKKRLAFSELFDSFDFEKSITKRAPKFLMGDMPLEFEQCNRVGDNVEYKSDNSSYCLPAHVFYARFALTVQPSAMPTVMKFCQGKISFSDVQNMYHDKGFSDKDKFVGYDLSKIKSCANVEGLIRLSKRILAINETQDPTSIVYKDTAYYEMHSTTLKPNEKVEVFFPDFCEYYKGVVCSIGSGVKIRYEDGEVFPLTKYQSVEPIK